MSHRFHEGELAVQTRAGVAERARKVGAGIHAEIPPRGREFLGAQPFAVLAGGDTRGRVWASLVTGAPGFLHAPAPGVLEVDAALLAGDPLAAGLVRGAPVGALVVDLATRRRMRVNGVVERAVAPLRIRVAECFSNCPRYIQRRALAPAPPAGEASLPPRTTAALSPAQRRCIAGADTFFVASRHAEAGYDASHRGGRPGFVAVVDERRLAWPDYAGNAMFQTLGNLAEDPGAGLLFVDFASGDGLQLTGRARVDFDPARAARHPGAERMVDFAIEEVREAPGALPLRASAVELSPHVP